MTFDFAFLAKYWKQFFAVFTATFGSISNGMAYAWASPPEPKLRSSDIESYWIETMYTLGAAASVPATYALLQLCGRSRSLTVATLLSLISWILIATASTLQQIYVARFFSGLGSSIAFVSISMYAAEISQPKIRGFLSALISTMSVLGMLILNCVAPYVPIYVPCVVGAAATFLQILTYPFRPESPYYLLLKDKKSEAMASLRKLRHDPSLLQVEMDEIAAAVDRQRSERSQLIELVVSSSNRKASVIMMCLNIAANMSGYTVIMMNVQSVLRSTDTFKITVLSTIFYSVAMLTASLLGTALIDYFGRRILLISSSLLIALCLALLSAFFYVKDIQQADTSNYRWLPLLCIIAYTLCYNYGMGQVPSVICAELFPTSVKSMGMVISVLWFTVSATISIKIYYETVASYGMYFPFMLFAIFPILNALFVLFYVPETKGKSLEQIQIILKGNTYKETKLTLNDSSLHL